jgi:hypothetical protein
MTDAIKKAREALADRIVRDVCELEGYTSPENQPDLLEATTGELRAIILNALAAEQSRPEPEGMETTATQRDLWKAVNYDKVAPADPSSMWRRIEMLCRDIDRLLAALRQPAADDVEAMAQRLDAHVPDGFADLHKAAAMLRALSRQPAADEVEDVAAILETAVRPVYVGEGQFRSIGREAAAMLRAFSRSPAALPVLPVSAEEIEQMALTLDRLQCAETNAAAALLRRLIPVEERVSCAVCGVLAPNDGEKCYRPYCPQNDRPDEIKRAVAAEREACQTISVPAPRYQDPLFVSGWCRAVDAYRAAIRARGGNST